MALVYYRKTIRDRVYPVAGRTGPYAFCHEVRRRGRVVETKYLGIRRIPEGAVVETFSDDVVESSSRPDFMLKEGGDAHPFGEERHPA